MQLLGTIFSCRLINVWYTSEWNVMHMCFTDVFSELEQWKKFTVHLSLTTQWGSYDVTQSYQMIEKYLTTHTFFFFYVFICFLEGIAGALQLNDRTS